MPPRILAALLLAACSAPPQPARPTVADAAAGETDPARRRAATLAPTLPGYTVVAEPPFVVIGDEAPAVVAAHAESTVRWATLHLEADLFARRPPVLDVWLFATPVSYAAGTQRLVGHAPTSPYGFFDAGARALIMNISTGGGTLVHEMVHPYIDVNVPGCPPWLNEGLASLYEQCGEVDGHIHGFTNWRLAGLKDAIRAGTVPRFADLLAMDAPTFYGETRGVNYAAARYLLYHLQGRGRLFGFFHAYLAARADDPTGIETLKATLGTRDLEAFQKEWEKEVLALTFP